MRAVRITILVCVLCLAFVWMSAIPTRCADKLLPVEEEQMDHAKKMMIDQLIIYGIKNKNVIEAMHKVRRHKFFPEGFMSSYAYGNHPLPIGHNQTISQPYIVAYMTEKIAPTPGEKVLEIGTGSGYQAAVLAEMGADVYSIEIVESLAQHAKSVLKSEGYKVHVKAGDGYKGWSEHAPFSVIIVTCAPERLPEKLVEQLEEGGRMILPLGGTRDQQLIILRKQNGKIITEKDLPVRFVPMVEGDD